jgi:hypothetical protein
MSTSPISFFLINFIRWIKLRFLLRRLSFSLFLLKCFLKLHQKFQAFLLDLHCSVIACIQIVHAIVNKIFSITRLIILINNFASTIKIITAFKIIFARWLILYWISRIVFKHLLFSFKMIRFIFTKYHLEWVVWHSVWFFTKRRVLGLQIFTRVFVIVLSSLAF